MNLIWRLERKIKCIRNRNKPPVKLYWWRYRYPEKLNFGDEITPYIIKSIWGIDCVWTDPSACDMAGTGSIIDIVREGSNGNVVKIWGSGYIEDGPANSCDNLDFYAVRGYSTLKRIQSKRKLAVGDPGLLASLAFDLPRNITHKFGVVFHYSDEDDEVIKSLKSNSRVKLINPLQSPEKVAMDIMSCELVLSSSLHGLVVADSFSVPNYWLPLSNRLMGGDYKFIDYYSATGREIIKKDPSIFKGDKDVEKSIREYKPVVGLKSIQRTLIKSFPFN